DRNVTGVQTCALPISLSAANAAALREVFEVLRPRLIGESTTSVGTGDRLGLATAGQARAFREQGQGTVPVLAQQSIREMDRLSRSEERRGGKGGRRRG